MHQQTESIAHFPASIIPPALLIVGDVQSTADYAVRYINKILCKQGGCNSCVTCKNIAEHHHYALLWLEPGQRYTLEMLEIIQETILLSLDEDTHFFFVLSQADGLSVACANSLLKMVEEPPTGYHFIFLAEQAENILPTIRSRCFITQLHRETHEAAKHPLFHFFLHGGGENPAQFLKALDQSKITEQECVQLFDALLHHWANVYTRGTHEKQQKAYEIAQLLREHVDYLPMSGSSKLFLKNIYLNIHHIVSKK